MSRDMVPDSDVCQICGKLIGRDKGFYRDCRQAGDENDNPDRWVHIACVDKQAQAAKDEPCSQPKDPVPLRTVSWDKEQTRHLYERLKGAGSGRSFRRSVLLVVPDELWDDVPVIWEGPQ